MANAEQARLGMCSECNKHGRIVVANGSIGPEVFSQPFALWAVKQGVRFKKISLAEKQGLFAAIEASDLAKDNKLVDRSSQELCRFWNQIRSISGDEQADPKLIHVLFRQAEKIVREVQKIAHGMNRDKEFIRIVSVGGVLRIEKIPRQI